MDKTSFDERLYSYGQLKLNEPKVIEDKILDIFTKYSLNRNEKSEIIEYFNRYVDNKKNAALQLKFIRIFENRSSTSFLNTDSIVDRFLALFPFQFNKLSLYDLLILIDNSEYFERLLRSQFIESKNKKIGLKGVSQVDIKRIVEVLKCPSLIKGEELVYFYEVSDGFLIPSLKSEIEKRIKKCSDFDRNLFDYLEPLKESYIMGAAELYDIFLTRQIMLAENPDDFEFAIQYLENSDGMQYFIDSLFIRYPLIKNFALTVDSPEFERGAQIALLPKYLPNLEYLCIGSHPNTRLTFDSLSPLQHFTKLNCLVLRQPIVQEVPDSKLLPTLNHVTRLEIDEGLVNDVLACLDRLPNLQILKVGEGYNHDLEKLLNTYSFAFDENDRTYRKQNTILMRIEPDSHLELVRRFLNGSGIIE